MFLVLLNLAKENLEGNIVIKNFVEIHFSNIKIVNRRKEERILTDDTIEVILVIKNIPDIRNLLKVENVLGVSFNGIVPPISASHLKVPVLADSKVVILILKVRTNIFVGIVINLNFKNFKVLKIVPDRINFKNVVVVTLIKDTV